MNGRSSLPSHNIARRQVSAFWISLPPRSKRPDQSAAKRRLMRRVSVSEKKRLGICGNLNSGLLHNINTYPFRSLFKSTNGASTSSGATRPDRAADRRIASLTPSLTSAPVSSARSRFCSSTPSSRFA